MLNILEVKCVPTTETKFVGLLFLFKKRIEKKKD